jgi:hypothetical protein
VLITPSLGVPNWSVIYINTAPSLAHHAKKKEVVLGDAYGLKTRYNILICLFRENIAPSAGNLDAICGSLVNLLAYSHEVFMGG